MMKKAVIFDMGGVLIDLDLEKCKDAFKKDLGYENIDNILDPCHQKGIIGEMEEGMIDADTFRKEILAGSRPGVLPEDVDKALWNILSGIQPYKIEMLKRIAASYEVYMLSNNNPICLPHAVRMFEEAGFSMKTDFRKCYMSFEMKALKPSATFYKAVVADIGLPAEDMLFIDDSRLNVEGAVAAGLPAVYYEPGSDLSALLAEVLGDPSIKVERK